MRVAQSALQVQIRNRQRRLVRLRIIPIGQHDDGHPLVGEADDHVAEAHRFAGVPLRAVAAVLAVAPSESVADGRVVGYWWGSGDVALRFNSSGATWWIGGGPTYLTRAWVWATMANANVAHLRIRGALPRSLRSHRGVHRAPLRRAGDHPRRARSLHRRSRRRAHRGRLRPVM